MAHLSPRSSYYKLHRDILSVHLTDILKSCTVKSATWGKVGANQATYRADVRFELDVGVFRGEAPLYKVFIILVTMFASLRYCIAPLVCQYFLRSNEMRLISPILKKNLDCTVFFGIPDSLSHSGKSRLSTQSSVISPHSQNPRYKT